MKQELVLTEEQLREAVETYKKRLKLRDWDIDVHLVPQRAIDEKDGQASVIIQNKNAVICMPTPETFWSSADRPYNMLLVLCHEMLHLLFPYIKEDIFRSHSEAEMFEQGLNILAEVIVGSKPIEEGE